MTCGELLGRWTRGWAGRAASSGGMQTPCLTPYLALHTSSSWCQKKKYMLYESPNTLFLSYFSLGSSESKDTHPGLETAQEASGDRNSP